MFFWLLPINFLIYLRVPSYQGASSGKVYILHKIWKSDTFAIQTQILQLWKLSFFYYCSQSKVSTVAHAHSRLGVCSLSVHNGYVWSTGRDGTVKQFSVRNHSLELETSSKLPFNWIAQIIHTENMGSLVLSFHEVCSIYFSQNLRSH